MSTRTEEKDRTFLEMAHVLGRLGTCDRAHVGAIITRNGRAISWGYNGAAPGMPHCDATWHGWVNTLPKGTVKASDLEPGEHEAWAEYMSHEHGCRNVIHAEANAIAAAARQGISTDGCTMYVERSPCVDCARLIIAAGIEVVVTSIIYRDPEGWNMLPGRRFIDASEA